MARADLEAALREGTSPAQLRRLLAAEMARGREELARPRAGREEPVTVAFAPGVAVAPADPGPDPGGEKTRRLVDAVAAALREAGEGPLQAGAWEGHLALAVAGSDPDLAAVAFDEAQEGIDRLRAAAVVVPALEATGLREVRPPAARTEIRPHDDPDRRRRAARRMLQTLRSKGKWGGYHTEFRHLARGFEGHERREALEVGEALVAAGLLLEKPSTGQRHVFLNTARKADIDRLVDDGAIPADLEL
jgi:hypothetical protein